MSTTSTTYLCSDVDGLAVIDSIASYDNPESNNDIDKEIQCDLLNEDNILNYIDPTRLAYHERLHWHLREFCSRTSSHGIPMLTNSPNLQYKATWVVLLIGCLAMFVYQACDVVAKYQKNGKITDIQLQFDTAPFPAISICNLNPYKDSAIQNVASIKKILNVYSNVMNKAGESNKATKEMEDKISALKLARHKRAEGTVFETAYSECTCSESTSSAESDDCVAQPKDVPNMATDYCICAFDRESGDAWPCHPKSQWTQELCAECDSERHCKLKAEPGKVSEGIPCTCQMKGEPFCLTSTEEDAITKLWEYYGYIPVDEAQMLEALGFSNMTDEVAIVTKAKENIIFAMTELSEETRRSLSVQKLQLIQKCSFNGEACDIDKDFKIVTDPTFGNCFTFNHDKNETKTSIRAGAQYGLRILVYVNASDYLATTEAVGVRITIHDKDEYPYPDTFGYNAPTGYISSFGMKLQKMNRLPAPFGDCVERSTKLDDYIYTDYRYSTEGCYRTCFQHMVVKDCGCGDPRFPVTKGLHCQVFNPIARKCLEEKTKNLGDENASFKCICHQPCEQSVYTVSYSAAIWPSESLNITLPACVGQNETCNGHYTENGAMIEMFYEVLNFEVFTESVAYGLVKMLADFGGQLGLWSGVSFLTCCEFVFLFFEVIFMMFNHYHAKKKAKRMEAAKDVF
uniref:Degenerin mec-10 n=1 Tax=Rhabditophanes sp. KR3021 TaxID=114890 RepID=A0AC35U7H9_9BILA